MARGSGFRKTILIGDHFVLYDVPAIVAALPFTITATVEKTEGSGWILEDRFAELLGGHGKHNPKQTASINRILDQMGIDVIKDPIKITYDGDFLPGSGLGASAAACVSLVKALNEAFERHLPMEEINRISWEGEAPYHGKPSGVDNTASCYGGILLYTVKGADKRFEKIITKGPIPLVLADSGIRTDTALLRPYTEQLKAEDPVLFADRLNRIRQQALRMKDRLEADDVKSAGAVMTENQGLLKDMGLSHPIIDSLCTLALEKGACGAKVTGGGRGGYMAAVAPDTGCQAAVAAAIEAKGYSVIRAVIHGQ